MVKAFRLIRALLLILFIVSVVACAAPTPPASQTQATNAPAVAGQATTPAAAAPTAAGAAQPAAGGDMTDVGTPRSETLIVQTFDGKTDNPDNMNPLSGSYAIWRGFRELGWGYLWSMDTAKGKPYAELATDLPTATDANHTQFDIGLKKGVYWSDGTEFTADDVIYTLDTYFAGKGKLTYFGVHQPAQMTFNLPEGEQYQATIIDTWAMTATPLDEPVATGATVRLPGKPYQALLLRRA